MKRPLAALGLIALLFLSASQQVRAEETSTENVATTQLKQREMKKRELEGIRESMRNRFKNAAATSKKGYGSSLLMKNKQISDERHEKMKAAHEKLMELRKKRQQMPAATESNE